MTKPTRARNPCTDSIEVSADALSMKRISALVAVASSDSIHARYRWPEFQLMIATVLVMPLCREHQHDVHWVDSKRQAREAIQVRKPRRIARKTVQNQLDAGMLPNCFYVLYVQPMVQQYS